jgi:hypothetical protein
MQKVNKGTESRPAEPSAVAATWYPVRLESSLGD